MRIIFALLGTLWTVSLLGQVSFSLEEFARGFEGVVDLANNGIDERIYVVERSGRIKILETDGSVKEALFLDIDDRVLSANNTGERGLLGMAFHPDYDENGYFFVNYTNQDGDTQISRFSVNADNQDQASPDSEESVMTIPQPFTNHNGGDLAFGPDGYLYIGTGDGGSANDPLNNGQIRQSLLGKMLRIDVDELPYTIPEDNPFAEDDETLDEIWALGLRNPWRYSFDLLKGDLWIADVGQNEIEEIDFQPAESAGGENYGWRCFEGSVMTPGINQENCPAYEETTPPLFEYNHNPGNHCSITGGYVYRGCQYPTLHGFYIYTDFCSGVFWGLRWNENGDLENVELGNGFHNFTTLGETASGQLYAADLYEGKVFKMVADFEIVDIKTAIVEDTLVLYNGEDRINNRGDFSVQWYFNDQPIEGADEWEYVHGLNGSYYAILTHSSGCQYISNIIDYTTSAFDAPQHTLTFYPNPLGDYLMIDGYDKELLGADITLLNIHGQMIYQAVCNRMGGHKIDTQNLPTGIYLVQVETHLGTITQKMVKW